MTNMEFLLNCRRLPCRLTAEQVAVLVGCQPHDIPILVRAKLLKALGDPAPNSTKWFAATDLESKLADEKWVGRVTATLYAYWRESKSRPNTNHN
jgi:hypothetical protein